MTKAQKAAVALLSVAVSALLIVLGVTGWEAYHAALHLEHVPLPLGFTPMRMPCAGKIGIDYLLQAFALGADGVLVLSCHPDNCKSQQGNEHALWRVERAQVLLSEAGVDPQRLLFKTLAPNSPGDFLAAVTQLMENLETLQAAGGIASAAIS